VAEINVNPTPGQIQSIKSFVAGLAGVWSNSDAQIRAAMAATKVANPLPQATVPKPYTATQLLGLLSAASIANLAAFPAIHDLFSDISAQNSANVEAASALLAAAGKITSAEQSAIVAAVTATEPDPSWTSTVAWDVANLGRVADDFDLEAARFSH
jgi:hypothetical protein